MANIGEVPVRDVEETYGLKITDVWPEEESKPIQENSPDDNSDFEGSTEVHEKEVPLIYRDVSSVEASPALGGDNELPKEEKRLMIETPSDENCDLECCSWPKTRLKKLHNCITSDKFLFGVGIFVVGLVCGTMITHYSNNDKTTTNQSDHFEKPTEHKNLSAKERFHIAMNEFKSVGCKPRPIRMYTKSLLDPTDETIDMRLYPLFQYVNQCTPIMNYCPGTMECVPTEDGKKPYILHFKTESHYGEKYTVNIMEHTVCKCQSVMTRLSEPLTDQDQLSDL